MSTDRNLPIQAMQLKKAIKGNRGELDAWLEENSEEEVREAILALSSIHGSRDQLAIEIMKADLYTTGSRMPRYSDKCDEQLLLQTRDYYRLADAMILASQVQKPE